MGDHFTSQGVQIEALIIKNPEKTKKNILFEFLLSPFVLLFLKLNVVVVNVVAVQTWANQGLVHRCW